MAKKTVPNKLYTCNWKPEWRDLRLKEIVRDCLPELGSRQAFLAIKNGLVKVKGQGSPLTDADASAPEGKGLEIDLRHGTKGHGGAQRPQLSTQFRVVHDDAEVVVVSKGPGVLVQPAKNRPGESSLIELLKHYWKSQGQKSVNPVVVQRLDRDTSGLLVLAKNIPASRHLQKQFRGSRTLRREYLAVTAGVFIMDEGLWETVIGRGKGGKRQSLPPQMVRGSTNVHGIGKPAVTRFKVEERFKEATLVRLKLETGRTHQIRIHCAEAGHPLLGETIYLKHADSIFRRLMERRLHATEENHPFEEATLCLKKGAVEIVTPRKLPPRLALHACLLSFQHPKSGEMLKFEEPMPGDLERWIRKSL